MAKPSLNDCALVRNLLQDDPTVESAFLSQAQMENVLLSWLVARQALNNAKSLRKNRSLRYFLIIETLLEKILNETQGEKCQKK
jgi:hypothetical protein